MLISCFLFSVTVRITFCAESSAKNCLFTALHWQLALDHIGPRPFFFLRGKIIVFIFLALLANCLTPSVLSNLKSCTNIHGDIGTGN